MLGRFFALDSRFQRSCNHLPGEEAQASAMGCDKCYWKQKGKHRPAVIVTLVDPVKPEEESYPVVNGYDQTYIMPNSPW